MSRQILNLVFVLGIAIAFFGATVDFIMPGASPGLNVPQLLIIVVGALMALGSWRLRRQGISRGLSEKFRKSLRQALLVTLVTLLALEIALTAFGAPTYYPTTFSDQPLDKEPWWTCDELGCRFVHDAVRSACANGEMSGRACIVNEQGFGDNDAFTVGQGFDGRARILMLGDSFTQGYSADVGESFVEILEANLPDALVWNAGIGGTGTNQALATFAGLGPLFQPQLTILGFFINDFHDNLFPLDSKLRFSNDNQGIEAVRYYVLDAESNPVRLELTANLVEYARAGKLPIPNELERLFGNTRLGSLALQLKERIDGITVPHDPHFAREVSLTREYMSALRELVMSQGSAFMVLVIPFRPDIAPPEMRYEELLALLHDLEIPFLDPIDLMQAPEDFAAYPDIHWNSAGHRKVGALLSRCVDAFMSKGVIAECARLTIPGRQQ